MLVKSLTLQLALVHSVALNITSNGRQMALNNTLFCWNILAALSHTFVLHLHKVDYTWREKDDETEMEMVNNF